MNDQSDPPKDKAEAVPNEDANRKASGPAKRSYQWVAHLALWLLIPTVVIGSIVWLNSQVEQSVPLGQLVQVLPGWDNAIETEAGFLPVDEIPALPKGERLLLEYRREGSRYVCTTDRRVCTRVPSATNLARYGQE